MTSSWRTDRSCVFWLRSVVSAEPTETNCELSSNLEAFLISLLPLKPLNLPPAAPLCISNINSTVVRGTEPGAQEWQHGGSELFLFPAGLFSRQRGRAVFTAQLGL